MSSTDSVLKLVYFHFIKKKTKQNDFSSICFTTTLPTSKRNELKRACFRKKLAGKWVEGNAVL